MKLYDRTPRCEFYYTALINEKCYTVREPIPTGLTSALGSNEPMLYDAVDCPKCGKQVIVGKRYRVDITTLVIPKKEVKNDTEGNADREDTVYQGGTENV